MNLVRIMCRNQLFLINRCTRLIQDPKFCQNGFSQICSFHFRTFSKKGLVITSKLNEIINQRYKINISAEKLLSKCPSSIQPYLKLARVTTPTGTLLLLWPCFWSIALAANSGEWPNMYLISLFSLGAFLMRGAGCTINDMWDKDLDSKVERTKNRPLATGELVFTDALGFLALQLGLSTIVLLQLNWYSIVLGFCSMGLVVLYPLAKRFTNWPQLVLGFTFNWGALLGWSSVHGTCDWSIVLPLYAAGISWTLIYDTIYALQDKRDDIKQGIKSTALLFGKSTRAWITIFSGSMMTNLILLGSISQMSWPYYSSLALIGGHLGHQVLTLKPNLAEDCAEKFKSNSRVGLILFLGIVAGNYLKKEKSVVERYS